MNLNDIKKSNLREYARKRYGIKCDASGKTLCPFHNDKNPSLSFFQTKAGFWRFKCFGCDKNGSIVDLKMELESLSRKEACSQLLKEFKEGKILPSKEKDAGLINQTPTKKEAIPKKEKKIKHKIEYDYKDQDGNIAYKKVKLIYFDGSKKLFFKHEIKDKGWDWGQGDHPHIPYNLHLFKGHENVIICEGEKDATTINRLKIGLLATTAPAGKGSWPDTITPYFKSFKKATFIYDVGAEKDVKKHATKLQKNYPEMHIFIASVPMDKEGNDITDYLVSQRDRAMSLLDVLDKSKEFKIEDPEAIEKFTISSWANSFIEYIEKRRANEIWGHKIKGFPRLTSALMGLREITILAAKPKIGKTTFILQIESGIADQGAGVIHYDFENGRYNLMARECCRRFDIEYKQELLNDLWLEFDSLREKLHRIENFAIVTDRQLTIDKIKKHILDMRRRTGNDNVLISIDSLQKLPMENLRERRAAVDIWLRNFEELKAEDPYLTILLVSELSREGQRPKESGDIEYTGHFLLRLESNQTEEGMRKAGYDDNIRKLWIEHARDVATGGNIKYQADFNHWKFAEMEEDF